MLPRPSVIINRLLNFISARLSLAALVCFRDKATQGPTAHLLKRRRRLARVIRDSAPTTGR